MCDGDILVSVPLLLPSYALHSTLPFRPGRSLPPPPPVAQARSVLFRVTTHGSEKRGDGVNKKRAGEGGKKTKSLGDEADTNDVRGGFRRSSNGTRENVQRPPNTERNSDASGLDIHQILRLLQHLERNTKAPARGLSRHRFSRAVAVPPSSAKMDTKEEIETGGARGHGKKEMEARGSGCQRTEMVALLDSSGSFGV